MRKRIIDEYDMPDMNSDYYMPVEEGSSLGQNIVPEESSPVEISVSSDEYNQNVDEMAAAKKRKRRNIKDYFLKPVAAVMIGVTAIYASFNIDPLGLDLFADGTLSGFPTLGNLDPDWDGNYAWNEDKLPELYIRYTGIDGNGRYIVRGDAWEDTGYEPEEGIFYDAVTNTLTLSNFTATDLDVNLMGNGFKIRLEGENRLNSFTIWGAMYAGSVRFTGDGKLTIEGDSECGLLMYAEMSQTCLMVERGVTLDISGQNGAIDIESTTMEKAIYLLDESRLTGGTVYTSSFEEPDGEHEKMYFHTVMDGEDNPATHVVIGP